MVVVCVRKNAPCRKQDPFIALSYFELYANALGLGTLWCGIADGAIMLFGEPEVKFPRATMQEPYGISSAGI